MTTIAVSGATGRLGGRVAARLTGLGLGQRLVVRDLGRAPSLPGAEPVQAEYRDGDALRRALQGADVFFMVSGSEEPDRVGSHRSAIDAAAAAGVGHLVYTSFFRAAPDATFTLVRDHWATEEHLRASGVTHTILRDNLYLDFLPLMAGPDGAIRGPAGDGRMAGVALDDVADVAVAVLRDPAAHAGATYSLTGPEALSLAEAAATLTAVTGKPVRYEQETLEEAYASRAHYGAPDWQVEAWVTTYTAIAAGELDGVTDDVPRVTGHRARSLADLLARG